MNAQTQTQVPAMLRSLPDIVDEYDQKVEEATTRIAEFQNARTKMELDSCVAGQYVPGGIWGRYGTPGISTRQVHENLLKSAWRHVYEGLNIGKIASAKDRKRFEMDMENPAPFTLENIRATFGEFLVDPRHHILKGLAECFADLDRAYKSHSKVKIGVKGLPKRVIINNVAGEFSYGSHGRGQFEDSINALLTYWGEPRLGHIGFSNILKTARRDGEACCPGGKVQVYQNGNAHWIFDKESLVDINKALAEFYGEVLPDAEEDDAPPDLFRSREVAKNLQFYATPPKVIDTVLNRLDIRDGMTVLEPSCGDGRFMQAIRKVANVRMTGVEVHPGRAEMARLAGLNVMCTNFLETAPQPKFDLVVMNPPFYGRHWIKHLLHARKFLVKHDPNDRRRYGGGTLICILPATAFYDGHLGELGICPPDAHTADRGWVDSGWMDLPVGSFAESGTNVPTGYLTLGPEK